MKQSQTLIMEVDQKNVLARKAEELERKVDETRRVNLYDRLVVAIGEFMGGPQHELDLRRDSSTKG